jgi:hypothetical protein
MRVMPTSHYWTPSRMRWDRFVSASCPSAVAPQAYWLRTARPRQQRILGFSNRWYAEAARTASPFELPSGLQIRLISAPTFAATKLEAFAGRGRGDYRASHDLEDIVSLVNGRVELPDEVGSAAAGLRSYLANRSGALLAEPKFIDALPGHLPGDETSQARTPMVLDRLKRISLLS